MIINSNPGKYLAAWASRNAKAAYSEIQEKAMTTAIEVTKREMYEWLGSVKRLADSQASAQAGEMLELCLEEYLEWLGKDRTALTTERDTLRNRVQVLEMANQTSGEVIRSLKREAEQARKALMVARLTEFAAQVSCEQENVASVALDAKTEAVLSAVVDCQRVITDWSLEEIKSKEAMQMIVEAVNTPRINSALYAFEKARTVQPKEEITGASLSSKFFSGRTIASVAIDKMVKDAMRNGTGWIRMTSNEDGVEITNLPADEVLKKPGCQHSFHYAHEHCIYCGVRK